uniref:Constitutive coactivator of PPAR-gamma-like protein 2 n=1 Tax=Chelonoidis abingdonii TaxID=106734 RepID=A0A8C0HBN3_CHEAB
MGVQGFQEFVEKRCPGAVVPVDLLKLARAAGVRGGPPYCGLAGYLQPLPGPYPPPLHAPGLASVTHSQHAPGLATVAAHSQHAPGLATACPARLLVDADSALQRLYGGYQTDWVCGGQWNAMVGYLAALSQACLYQGGLELVIIFNGGLGKERLPEWGRKAQAERQTAQLIAGHVGNKGTPPPRAWFLPPACLEHCVRLAMIRFRVKVSILNGELF